MGEFFYCCSSAQNTHEKWFKCPRRQSHVFFTARILHAFYTQVGEECTFVGLSKLNAALPIFQQCVVRETCNMEVRIYRIGLYMIHM